MFIAIACSDTAAHVFPNSPSNVKTIVDLLEAKDISWAACEFLRTQYNHVRTRGLSLGRAYAQPERLSHSVHKH